MDWATAVNFGLVALEENQRRAPGVAPKKRRAPWPSRGNRPPSILTARRRVAVLRDTVPAKKPAQRGLFFAACDGLSASPDA
jgi:hypothetical protein